MKTHKPLKRIPAGVWVLGLVSLFMDISSENPVYSDRPIRTAGCCRSV